VLRHVARVSSGRAPARPSGQAEPARSGPAVFPSTFLSTASPPTASRR